jgi:hypothetical protein
MMKSNTFENINYMEQSYHFVKRSLMKYFGIFLTALLIITPLTFVHSQEDSKQEAEAFMIRSIYDQALTGSSAYSWLTHLSEEIGGRLAGSKGSIDAVHYTANELKKLGMDTVWLQPCMVPRWERRGPEIVQVTDHDGRSYDLKTTTLGNSNGSKASGEIIEVHSLDEVEELGAAIKGKIVFFNRPMDPKQINVFYAYGGAVDQMGRGPAISSRNGAVGCIVRSMTTNHDDIPHSGMTKFLEGEKHIPAMAISTNDAEKLSEMLKEGPVNGYMENQSRLLADTMSYSVVGQINGSEHPDSILLVGGHLDSWDLAGGAHDDGAGCVQSMAVIELFNKMNYKPKHTLRCVLFMNEENGLGGGRAYRDSSNARGEYHLAALESDSGGFSPRGFRTDGHADVLQHMFKNMYQWLPLLQPYGLDMYVGGSGADISPLKSQKGLLIGLSVDTQRYFDFHHTVNDRIWAVNKRELELGVAAMSSLIYLIDQNGL